MDCAKDSDFSIRSTGTTRGRRGLQPFNFSEWVNYIILKEYEYEELDLRLIRGPRRVADVFGGDEG